MRKFDVAKEIFEYLDHRRESLYLTVGERMGYHYVMIALLDYMDENIGK